MCVCVFTKILYVFYAYLQRRSKTYCEEIDASLKCKFTLDYNQVSQEVRKFMDTDFLLERQLTLGMY